MNITPLACIAVGVLVERRESTSPWAKEHWATTRILAGVPGTPPWTKLDEEAGRATFYAGAADIELYRSETGSYGDNLLSDAPVLWVILRASGNAPPYCVFAVTADPAEGEAFAQAGDDIVDAVPMPPSIQETIARFVAEHHVDRRFIKRVRDRSDPGVMSRGEPE